MSSKEDVLERIGLLSRCVSQAREDVDELTRVYQNLARNASDATVATGASVRALDRLAKLIEADELSLDEGVERVADLVADMHDAVISDVNGLNELIMIGGPIDGAGRAMNSFVLTQQDLLNAVSRLR